jgi:hypothetical protein
MDSSADFLSASARTQEHPPVVFFWIPGLTAPWEKTKRQGKNRNRYKYSCQLPKHGFIPLNPNLSPGMELGIAFFTEKQADFQERWG